MSRETDGTARIRAWLAGIGETDPETIAEVLERVDHDPAAAAYFLQRAEEGDQRQVVGRTVGGVQVVIEGQAT